MAERGRYGRRKQQNPRRKNVENETTESPSTVDKIAAVISRQKQAINGLHDNKEINHDNQKPEITEQTKAEIKEDLMHQKENLSPKVPGCLGDSEETIKEFLGRSDTAIIYPEPVSDQDEDNKETDSVAEEYELKCIYCPESFTKPTHLHEHFQTKHPEEPIKFQCPKCNEAFPAKTLLDKHLLLHSPTSQICKTCNKTFANVYRLQRHMISHDESNDLRKFKCPECSKAFKFKHHLKEHIRIHSGEKPFECPNCAKRFSHSGSYSSHMTSKKCWAVNMKGRRVDRNDNNENSMYYRLPTTMNNSIPITQPPNFTQIMKYDPRSALPAYYSPPMTTRIPTAHIPTTSIMTYGLYSNHPYSTSVLAKALSAPPRNMSPVSRMSQISPDVNFNTKIQDIKVEKKSDDDTEVKVKDDADDASRGAEANSPHESSKCAKMVETQIFGEDGKPLTIADLTCRFCHNCFKSPVELHQHERYLCKSNKDITLRISTSEGSRYSPNSFTSEHSVRATSNGSFAETGSEDDNEVDDDDHHGSETKKYRMRSLISDEQLAILKGYYQINPRPGKVELVKIANEIGFSKRVAQVWFQNMRARDRRRGKDVPYFPNMARFKHTEDIPTTTSASLGYIPVVPQPFANFSPSVTSTPVSKLNHSISKPITTVAESKSQDEPLDLSIKKCPPAAHSGSSSPALSNKQYDDQVLNLSCKTVIKEEPSKIDKIEGSIQGSAIFKYMQQEGLFSHQPTPLDISRSWLSHSSSSLNSTKSSSPSSHSRTSSPSHQIRSPLSRTCSPPHPIKTEALDSSGSHPDEDDRLVIDETRSDHKEMEDHLNNRIHYDSIEGRQNLDTLATVSLAAMGGEYGDEANKNKRQRKKSWRQVEAEEIQTEMEDSLSQDDDEPMKKKRKSWKNHRVDLEVGMYACDQCDKLFSKQSSLARHKYEHSGARPFTCDVCPKSFKHKHHLTEHKRLHSGEKPFRCKKCNKRFSHSGSYSQHMNHRYKYCKPTDSDLD